MARAGRFGEDAVRYMMRTPAAGVLFRRLAEGKASDKTVEKLLKLADREIGAKKEPHQMRSGRSGFYRRRDGEERLWLSPADIENMMEDALRKSGVFPTDEQPSCGH